MKYINLSFINIVFILLTLGPIHVLGNSTINYQCKYLKFADTKGVSILSKSFKLSFVFDRQAKKSYVVGNQGSARVTFIPNKYGGGSFIEITQSGNVMVTTITQHGKSVHSRNGIIIGRLTPSQYYGTCTIK